MTQLLLTELVSKLDSPLRASLEGAAAAALNSGSASIEIEHWLLEIWSDPDDTLLEFTQRQKIDETRLREELEGRLPKNSGIRGAQPTLSAELVRLVQDSWLLASVNYSDTCVRALHLMLGLLQQEILGIKAVRYEALAGVSIEALGGQIEVTEFPDRGKPVAPGNPVGAGGSGGLEKYSINLTEEAREGRLRSIVGRSDELHQLIDILARKGKNNPILVGEPGVGKTAVVEALAQRVVEGDIPDFLESVEIYSLDIGLLEAGASVKGEFENRLKDVVNEVKNSDTPIIVFIDEAHLLIGDGGGGRIDAANLLKPALARGEFRTIAATTWAEYKRHIEKDPALTRRFDIVKVAEPSLDDARRILRDAVNDLEAHHGVMISDDAVDAAVDLSVRYIPERKLPDKALGLLDTACARVSITQKVKPKAVEKAKGQLDYLKDQRSALHRDERRAIDVKEKSDLLDQELEQASGRVDELNAQWEHEKGLLSKLNDLHQNCAEKKGSAAERRKILQLRSQLADIQKSGGMTSEMVDRHVIASIISEATGVPAGQVESSEAIQLRDLQENLQSQVIGQKHAIAYIAETVCTSRVGLQDGRKPIGSFLLCGPSGVGKTETALALSQQIFGSEQNLVTINMSEFKEEHKVSMLLGAPAGYVGYGEGGVLTEAVRRQPYSLLLLDEIEKAHPGVHDVFYQILDKGYARDSEGRDVDFRNCLLVMTSNIGDDLIASTVASQSREVDIQSLTKVLRPELLKYFKTAFLGRLTVVPYLPLSEEELVMIAEIAMGRIRSQLLERYNATLTYPKKVLEALVSQYNDPGTGGRAIEQALSRKVLPQLGQQCLAKLIEGDQFSTVAISLGKDRSTIEIKVT